MRAELATSGATPLAGSTVLSPQTKVPELITVYFWAIKILSTGMGEATSDYLAHQFNPFLAAAMGFVGFAIALLIQFRAPRYWAWAYWLAVALVSVFGTMAADGLHFELGIPFPFTTLLYLLILIAVLALWYRREGTLSIHSVDRTSRELFYWAAVLAAFALGTAVGDLSAYTIGLGFLVSGLIFSGLFLLPGLAYWLFRLNAVVAFWIAYTLTRPVGASFADFMGVPQAAGGLGWGRGTVALLLAIPMVLLVGYLIVSRVDVAGEMVAQPAADQTPL
ncbi:MAG: COG4705 family protein [Candidatus Dormibacteria bacterium]